MHISSIWSLLFHYKFSIECELGFSHAIHMAFVVLLISRFNASNHKKNRNIACK